LILVILGFTFIAVSVWGFYLVDFDSIVNALFTLLLSLMGCYDLSLLIDRGLNYALPFLACYQIFIFQFMFGIIAIIYVDSYRTIVIDEGNERNKDHRWES